MFRGKFVARCLRCVCAPDGQCSLNASDTRSDREAFSIRRKLDGGDFSVVSLKIVSHAAGVLFNHFNRSIPGARHGFSVRCEREG